MLNCFCAVAMLSFVACNSSITTSLHLHVTYDSAWQLPNFDVATQDLSRDQFDSTLNTESDSRISHLLVGSCSIPAPASV